MISRLIRKRLWWDYRKCNIRVMFIASFSNCYVLCLLLTQKTRCPNHACSEVAHKPCYRSYVHRRQTSRSFFRCPGKYMFSTWLFVYEVLVILFVFMLKWTIEAEIMDTYVSVSLSLWLDFTGFLAIMFCSFLRQLCEMLLSEMISSF